MMKPEFKNVFIFDHPLIQHKVSMMRDKNTKTKEFRELTEEVSMLMAYEVTRNFELEEIEVETPLMWTKTNILSTKKEVTVIPILRAGLGMVDGILKVLPNAKVGHLGLYRDEETREPKEYYCKVPQNCAMTEVIMLDPMFATGGSAAEAVTRMKKKGCTDIRFVSILAAPEGICYFNKIHPDVPIFCAQLDQGLNEHAYIIPGLGDAGDRLFGTK